LFFLTVPVGAQAQFTYVVTNQTVTITGYTGPVPGLLAIPNFMGGYPVTGIGKAAFINCLTLTTVIIPNGISNIGDAAFGRCTNLTTVVIGPDVVNIGRSSLSQCLSLANITIPNSVTNILDLAFCRCEDLMNVTIGTNVANIAERAFLDCTKLTSLKIPASVTNIGVLAFGVCQSLKTIDVSSDNPAFSSINGVLFNKDQTKLVAYPPAKNGAYSIPFGVTDIGDSAIFGCAGLTLITVPMSVTNIEEYGLSSCDNLSGIYFQGTPPVLADSSVFSYDPDATAYYLPGTKGWDATLGGLPTAVWPQPNPSIFSHGVGFHGQNGEFSFVIVWVGNLSVVVEGCTNLTNPVWMPVATTVLTNGITYFGDPQSKNYPGRFYRVRSQ
jgi:hypothetical protein